MIVDINPNEKPLCPNISHEMHVFHIQLLDIASSSMAHNEDHEIINEESDRVYAALAYGSFDGRMYLYKQSVTVFTGGRITDIETWYFKCAICKLIIPATSTDTRP